MKYTAMIGACALCLAATSLAAPGGGKGKPPKDDDPPSEGFIPAFVYTEAGRRSSVKLANRELTANRTIAQTSDGRTDGLTVDPRGGRIVANEFRDLYEYRYDITAGGEVDLTQRTHWDGGPACLAIAHDGLAIRSSTVENGFHVRYLDGSEDPVVPTERMDSCDFYDGTHEFVAIVNPQVGANRLERYALDGTLVEVLYAPTDTDWNFVSVDVAPDGQTYLISWWDRRGTTSSRKVSIWQPGQDLLAIAPLAVSAQYGSWACDWNTNGSPDGAIYQTHAGNKPRWILNDGAIRDITPSKKGVYAMKATC